MEKIEKEEWDLGEVKLLAFHKEFGAQAIDYIVSCYNYAFTNHVRSKYKEFRISERTSSKGKLIDICNFYYLKFCKKEKLSDKVLGKVYTYFKNGQGDSHSTPNTVKSTYANLIACIYHNLKINSGINQGINIEELSFTPFVSYAFAMEEYHNAEIDDIIGSAWNIYSLRDTKKEIDDFTFMELTFAKNWIYFKSNNCVDFEGNNRSYEGTWKHNHKRPGFITVNLTEIIAKGYTPILRYLNIICPDPAASLLEGTMLTTNSESKIYHNAIILERTKVNSKRPKDIKPIIFHSTEYNSINGSIKDYFKYPRHRKSLTIGGVKDEITLKRNTLAEFITEKRAKYSIYFASPISNLEQKQHGLTQSVIRELFHIFSLKKKFLRGKEMKQPTGLNGKLELIPLSSLNKLKNNLKKHQECIEAFVESEVFVWVYLFEVPSISYIQASWVFKDNRSIKPAIFILRDSIVLPELMQNDKYHLNSIKSIRIKEDFINSFDLEKIVKVIKDNFNDIDEILK